MSAGRELTGLELEAIRMVAELTTDGPVDRYLKRLAFSQMDATPFPRSSACEHCRFCEAYLLDLHS